MTIRKLKQILNQYDEEQRIFFLPQNGSYIEDFSSNINEEDVCSIFGNDYKALILKSSGQCGSCLVN